MSQVTLVIIGGQGIGREFPVTGRISVGRDPSADLVIEDPEISTRHAAFAPANGGVTLEDLDSTNGTFVNGQRVTGALSLRPGDRVQVGSTVFEVRAAAAPPAGFTAPPGVAVTQAREIPTLPVLVFTSGQYAGSEMPVGGEIVVGRDPGVANVVLDQDPDVSRRHATFVHAGALLTVADLGSTNGTFVNGHRLTTAVSLSSGDRVEVGATAIDLRLPGETVIEAPAAPPPAQEPGLPPNGIEVEELVKEYANGYRAVDGVNLQVHPGEIFGFLGPNGAGKSTLVHMLTTLLPPSGGTARIAGYDIVTDGVRVREVIGVALQAAALDPLLNAWEHMALQTALQGLPKAARRPRSEELLERVGLIDAADRSAGGYSGGMKRRLDLALALVHSPRVLFLDEPTTGLDPQSRTALWEEVARLAKGEGATVFLTTQYLEEADVLADRVGIIDHGELVALDTPAALKEQIGRPTVEVIPQDNNDWEAISDVLQQFGEPATGTRGVAIRLRPGVDDLAEIVRALDSRKLVVANLELRAPTLDDVFLAKTGRSLDGAAEQAAEEQAEQEGGGGPGRGRGG